MTSDQQRQFEHLWPALSVRLHRLLSRKKVSPWLAEDLVQETGLRLIRMWPTIDQAKPLWPLTATIALNLFRDELRGAGSKESIQTLPDSPSGENVEERGMARVELRAVGGALAQMPAPQRDAILADLSVGTTVTPLASSARMLRMRARRRLQHLMDHASVLGIAVGVQMRRAIRELELVIGRVLPSDAERATAAAIGLLAAISLGVAVAPPSPNNVDQAKRGTGAASAQPDQSAVLASSMSSSVDALGSFARERARSGDSSRPNDLASSGRDRGAGDGSGDTAAGEREPQDFPGTFRYTLELTEDTYARGGIEADVFGGGGPNKDLDSLGRSPEGLDCTVSPSTGASCAVGEGGSESTGARAEHHGEARVAGRRIL